MRTSRHIVKARHFADKRHARGEARRGIPEWENNQIWAELRLRFLTTDPGHAAMERWESGGSPVRYEREFIEWAEGGEDND
jgi:hypothetical protein